MVKQKVKKHISYLSRADKGQGDIPKSQYVTLDVKHILEVYSDIPYIKKELLKS